MLKKTTIVALALALTAFVARAQEPATLLLKSGERVSGTLVDLGGAGFLIRVGDNERTIGKDDVAVVNFTGDLQVRQADLDKMNGQHIFVLRNGDTVRGHFYDIGGTSPLRLTVHTDSGERMLHSNDVARVILARPPDNFITGAAGGAAPTVPAGEGRLVRVPADRQWTATGITVRQGQRVNFSAGGQVRLNDPGDLVASPAGVSGRNDAKAPLPGAQVGALIGRIGAAGGVFGRGRVGQPFLIGDQGTVEMPAGGQLFLGVNDSVLTDNGGTFDVRINPTAPSVARR